jgi:flagellar basal body-associated protein FliL
MSDTSQGPGWWLASDGKWYGPEFRVTTPIPDPPRNSSFDPRSPADPRAKSSGRLWVVLSVVSALVIFAVVLSSILVVRSRNNETSGTSADFIAVMNDVTDAEDYSNANLAVFWQTFQAADQEIQTAPASRREAIVDEWLAEMRLQTGEFEQQLRGTTASLASLELPEGSTADRIRIAALRHYGTWETYTADLPRIAQEWTEDTDSDLDFNEYIDEQIPEITTEITDSFINLCGIMTGGQPENGDYEITIAEICALPDADVKSV